MYFSESGNSLINNLIIIPDNQIFITFTTDGNAVGEGFAAKITFGIRALIYCEDF